MPDSALFMRAVGMSVTLVLNPPDDEAGVLAAAAPMFAAPLENDDLGLGAAAAAAPRDSAPLGLGAGEDAAAVGLGAAARV